MQILLPEFKDTFAMNVTIEYAQVNETISMCIRYSGEPFDPLTSDNQLSLALLKNSVDGIEYSEIEDGEYTNQVILRLH